MKPCQPEMSPPAEINFQTLDLNLLRVFDALAEERSATAAGDRLCLSQSAISHALNRLRHTFNDELFTRGPHGMLPTPRALELAPRLRRGLMQLQLALEPPEFSPLESTRQFTISCPSYVSTVLLPSTIARIRAVAPHVGLRNYSSSTTIVQDLDSGQVDLAIGTFRSVPPQLACESLFSDSMVWAIRADHPLADGPLTLTKLAALQHVVLSVTTDAVTTEDGYVVADGLEMRTNRTDGGPIDRELATLGLKRGKPILVPDSRIALAIVGESDLAALVPHRMAAPLADHYRVKLFLPPYDSPRTEMMTLWHRGFGEQAALKWFRSLLKSVVASLERA